MRRRIQVKRWKGASTYEARNPEEASKNQEGMDSISARRKRARKSCHWVGWKTVRGLFFLREDLDKG